MNDVEEVGVENVIQIVIDNATNYKTGGDMLMQKRQKLYWTPCATHCIDLILGDFEKIVNGKKITAYIYSRIGLICLLHKHTKGIDLIRPSNTCFTSSYLNLGCLNENKRLLIRMFTLSSDNLIEGLWKI